MKVTDVRSVSALLDQRDELARVPEALANEQTLILATRSTMPFLQCCFEFEAGELDEVRAVTASIIERRIAKLNKQLAELGVDQVTSSS